MTQPSDKYDKRAARGGVGCLIVLAIVLVVGVKSCGSDGGGTSGDEDTAIRACEGSVEKQLKAPATAKFSNVNARRVDDTTYSVSGDVDSENSFGALLRSSWSGTATTSNGGDTWNCSANLFG